MMRCSKLEKTAVSFGIPPSAYRLLKAFKAASAPTTTANFWNPSQKSGWRAGTVGGDTRIYTKITSFRYLPGCAPRQTYSHTGIRVVVAVAVEHSSALCGFDHLLQRPYRPRNSSGHRRSRPQGFVHPAEVVPAEVQRQSRAQIRAFFRESIREPRQSANLHSHGQVLTFNVRRADFPEIWVSPFWDRHGIHNFGRRIVTFAIASSGIYFDQLRVINASAKAVMNGVGVGSESVRRELESPRRSFVQFFDESVGVSRSAASKVPRENQFCVAFDGDEAIGVSALGVASDISLFFAANKAPQLIALNFGNSDSADFVFEESFAFFSDKSEERQDRGVVDSRHTFDHVDGASFDQEFDDLDRHFQRRGHSAERRGVFFGESLAALTATEALKPVTMFPKLFAFRTAIVASHVGSPLVFLREKPDNHDLGSRCGLRPRLDSALLSVTADSRALSYLPQRISPAESERSSGIGPSKFALLKKPLQNVVKKCQRISARETVSPRRKRISDLYCAHRLTSGLIDYRPHKVGPRDLGFDLLAERILDADFGCFQLSASRTQIVDLPRYVGKLFPDVGKSLLEVVGHGYY